MTTLLRIKSLEKLKNFKFRCSRMIRLKDINHLSNFLISFLCLTGSFTQLLCFKIQHLGSLCTVSCLPTYLQSEQGMHAAVAAATFQITLLRGCCWTQETTVTSGSLQAMDACIIVKQCSWRNISLCLLHMFNVVVVLVDLADIPSRQSPDHGKYTLRPCYTHLHVPDRDRRASC